MEKTKSYKYFLCYTPPQCIPPNTKCARASNAVALTRTVFLHFVCETYTHEDYHARSWSL